MSNNKLSNLLLIFIFLFPSGVWAGEFTKNITIPAWSTDSVYGDNTVYEMALTSQTFNFSEYGPSSDRGGVYLEPFTSIPSPGDKRCLDDDCNYYLDISGIRLSVQQYNGEYTTYKGSWGNGGYKGNQSGSIWYRSTYRYLYVLNDSKIKIKKRNTGGVPVSIPSEGKTVTIALKQCDSANNYFYMSTCNSLNHGYPGIKLTLNITVPPPTLPKVQCYMSPWSNSINFQPVTVPVENSKSGQATWPLSGSNFVGVEKQSASLNVTCNNIDTGISSFPLSVRLSGANWTYGQNGELYFDTERSIAVAANLRMEATGNGTLNLNTSHNAVCQNYWSPSGRVGFEMGPVKLSEYLSANESACQFIHTLPTASNVVEGFRFTLNAILGVSKQKLTSSPTYGKHKGALMLEVNSL